MTTRVDYLRWRAYLEAMKGYKLIGGWGLSRNEQEITVFLSEPKR